MRTVSSTALRAMFSAETDEVFIVLLTISHPKLLPPLRVCSDSSDIVSRGNTFISYPFAITLPSDEESAPPKASITIDNVSKDIVDVLRTIDSPAEFTIEIIRAAAPDTVEIGYTEFELRNVKGDVFTLTGDLTVEDISSEPFPYKTFSPAAFPGLF